MKDLTPKMTPKTQMNCDVPCVTMEYWGRKFLEVALLTLCILLLVGTGCSKSKKEGTGQTGQNENYARLVDLAKDGQDRSAEDALQFLESDPDLKPSDVRGDLAVAQWAEKDPQLQRLAYLEYSRFLLDQDQAFSSPQAFASRSPEEKEASRQIIIAALEAQSHLAKPSIVPDLSRLSDKTEPLSNQDYLAAVSILKNLESSAPGWPEAVWRMAEARTWIYLGDRAKASESLQVYIAIMEDVKQTLFSDPAERSEGETRVRQDIARAKTALSLLELSRGLPADALRHLRAAESENVGLPSDSDILAQYLAARVGQPGAVFPLHEAVKEEQEAEEARKAYRDWLQTGQVSPELLSLVQSQFPSAREFERSAGNPLLAIAILTSASSSRDPAIENSVAAALLSSLSFQFGEGVPLGTPAESTRSLLAGPPPSLFPGGVRAELLKSRTPPLKPTGERSREHVRP